MYYWQSQNQKETFLQALLDGLSYKVVNRQAPKLKQISYSKNFKNNWKLFIYKDSYFQRSKIFETTEL